MIYANASARQNSLPYSKSKLMSAAPQANQPVAQASNADRLCGVQKGNDSRNAHLYPGPKSIQVTSFVRIIACAYVHVTVYMAQTVADGWRGERE